MALPLTHSASTLLVRKASFERAGLTRTDVDRALTLTDQEFRVEGELIAIGPVFDTAALALLVEAFERQDLLYFDDFFEMSGNWPEWLSVLVSGVRNRGAVHGAG